MKKAALLLLLTMMAGGILTGCGAGGEKNQKTSEKTAASPTPKAVTPTETSKNTKPTASGSNTDSSAQNSNSSQTENSKNPTAQEQDENKETDQGWDSIVLYDIDMNGVQVTRGDDGNWYDDNGISYGNLDNVDETQPIVNDNGDTYYWNGYYAELAAGGETSEDSDSSEEESPDTDTADISDPYDLYSWDEGTGQYIPFQQAESDGSPVGRGNGWYYYDEDSGEYLPW